MLEFMVTNTSCAGLAMCTNYYNSDTETNFGILMMGGQEKEGPKYLGHACLCLFSRHFCVKGVCPL